MSSRLAIRKLTLTAFVATGLSFAVCAFAADIKGQVLGGGAPIAQSTVTLWAASAGPPKQLAQTKTTMMAVRNARNWRARRYPLSGGLRRHAQGQQIGRRQPRPRPPLRAGEPTPSQRDVNELTTVASAFTNARFINGDAISGNPLGLRIAAGNVPNLVDPATGGWGKVLLDPLNSSHDHDDGEPGHTGLAHYGVVHGGQRRLARALLQGRHPAGGATPTNTLEAMAGIAREPWAAPRTSTHCSTKPIRCRHPMGGAVRPSYRILSTPPTISPSRCVSRAAGITPHGRFMFDAEGNLWSGMNWMPGSQSGVNKSTGGGVSEVQPQRNGALAADHRLHRHGH